MDVGVEEWGDAYGDGEVQAFEPYQFEPEAVEDEKGSSEAPYGRNQGRRGMAKTGRTTVRPVWQTSLSLIPQERRNKFWQGRPWRTCRKKRSRHRKPPAWLEHYGTGET
ncbi:hypothetical protein Bbelb_421320 [Branchiostoma belcheri]|nr:hypothetical protein Bbelb_421320 [Branchiostoma belcheri]